MPARQGREFFGRNASVLLDVLRFGAAVAVALSHMPLHFVEAGPIISERAGNQAVCVFFVLSGFVIRYVTVARVTTGRAYWVDRASRMYSVVAPMLLLTVATEAVAMWAAPGVYRALAVPFRWTEVPVQVAQNLFFTVGWWGWGATPLSNGPFWSLSFECVYYALYGLACFAGRARWWAVPLLLLAAGPSIALLFPIWLLGAGLYEGYKRLHRTRGGVWIAGACLLLYAAVLGLLRAPLRRLLEATDVAGRAALLTRAVAASPWGRGAFHGTTLHWLDRFSVSYFLTGSVLALGLLTALLGLDRWVPPTPARVAQWVRLVADSTFTLYLLHVPFFLLVVCLHGAPLRGWDGGSVMLGAAIAVSVGLAMSFDRLKVSMRRGMRKR